MMITEHEASVSEGAMAIALNGDLAGEYQALLMYNTYAAEVTGMERLSLAEFFRSEIGDELGHARFLAEKIVALGGRPTTDPAAVPEAVGARQMLERVHAAERDAIRRYGERMRQAETLGDLGLANELHDMISDETRHMEECEKLLRR